MSASYEAAKKLAQAIDVMADRMHEAFTLEAERMRPIVNAMIDANRRRDARIADAGIEVATTRTREADKVARLRSRIVGLYRALQESQEQARMNYATAEAHCRGLATHVAAAEERGALESQARIRGLRAELGNALRIGTQYREAAEQLQASLDKLHGEQVQPAEPMSDPEPDPIEEERPQVCKFGAPGCPGWPHNASDAARICPAHEELYERARRAGMPASGRHG